MTSLIETAIKYGTTECLKIFPNIHSFDIWGKEGLFKLAIEEPNETVYNYICGKEPKNKFIKLQFILETVKVFYITLPK